MIDAVVQVIAIALFIVVQVIAADRVPPLVLHWEALDDMRLPTWMLVVSVRGTLPERIPGINTLVQTPRT